VIYFAVHFIPDRRVSFYVYVFYIISSYFYIYDFSIGFWDFTEKYGLVFWDFHPMTNFVEVKKTKIKEMGRIFLLNVC
jgi:hypothetical protein